MTALYEAIADRIADGVLKILKNLSRELDTMGENGKTFYQQELAVAVGTKQLAVVLEPVAQ